MKNYKILIVDDEPNNIETIIGCLEENKYQILIATDGEAGYQIAKATKPNLIIMDWEMPIMSGIESIKKIKKDSSIKDIPIIMATGKMLRSENLQTALDVGAIDYIRKPIDEIELNARVNSMLRLYQTIEKNIELEKEILKQKELEIQKELDIQKKELAKNTLNIINNSELNTWLLQKIKVLNVNCNNDGKQIITEILNKYKINSINSSWDEFETVFEKVHRDFNKNLLNKFPNLTISEKRLCSFLKLNMTTKDISAITFQTESALKKARYRLRKKMNLDIDENISNYLSKF